jgi:hypothetical protein
VTVGNIELGKLVGLEVGVAARAIHSEASAIFRQVPVHRPPTKQPAPTSSRKSRGPLDVQNEDS